MVQDTAPQDAPPVLDYAPRKRRVWYERFWKPIFLVLIALAILGGSKLILPRAYRDYTVLDCPACTSRKTEKSWGVINAIAKTQHSTQTFVDLSQVHRDLLGPDHAHEWIRVDGCWATWSARVCGQSGGWRSNVWADEYNDDLTGSFRGAITVAIGNGILAREDVLWVLTLDRYDLRRLLESNQIVRPLVIDWCEDWFEKPR